MQNQEDDEHYDNVEDMYADLMDRLEAVEAAAPAVLIPHTGKAKGSTPEGAKGTSGGGRALSAEEEKERERERQLERERAAAAAAKAQLIAQGAL